MVINWKTFFFLFSYTSLRVGENRIEKSWKKERYNEAERQQKSHFMVSLWRPKYTYIHTYICFYLWLDGERRKCIRLDSKSTSLYIVWITVHSFLRLNLSIMGWGDPCVTFFCSSSWFTFFLLELGVHCFGLSFKKHHLFLDFVRDELAEHEVIGPDVTSVSHHLWKVDRLTNVDEHFFAPPESVGRKELT